MRACVIDACGAVVLAKEMCRKHYLRHWKHGDPRKVFRSPKGSGTISKGYRVTVKNKKREFDNRSVAERSLGKPLPAGAVVHHVDENPLNNDPGNLVICPSQTYHMILHRRLSAFKACGHYDWRQCWICHRYSDPATMRGRKNRDTFTHGECERAYANKRRNSHVSV